MSAPKNVSHSVFRPYVTWTLILLSIVFSLVLPSLDSSLYGVDGSTSESFGFSSGRPFKNSLIPIVTSVFLHADLKHLAINLLFLSVFAFLLERQLGHKRFALGFSSLHLLTLISLAALTALTSLEDKNYFGLSHVVFGLMSYWAVLSKKNLLLILMLAYLIYAFSVVPAIETTLSHALGYLLGIPFGVYSTRQNTKRKLRKSPTKS